MGNRRSNFVAETPEPVPVKFVCLVDRGIDIGEWHVREGETFIADPVDVAEFESKGFIARVGNVGEVASVAPPVEPEPEPIMNTEPSE